MIIYGNPPGYKETSLNSTQCRPIFESEEQKREFHKKWEEDLRPKMEFWDRARRRSVELADRTYI